MNYEQESARLTEAAARGGMRIIYHNIIMLIFREKTDARRKAGRLYAFWSLAGMAGMRAAGVVRPYRSFFTAA